jgi:hypothetical protein
MIASVVRKRHRPQRQRSFISGTSPLPSAISFPESVSTAHRQDLQYTCHRKPVLAMLRSVGSSDIRSEGSVRPGHLAEESFSWRQSHGCKLPCKILDRFAALSVGYVVSYAGSASDFGVLRFLE